MFVKPGASVLVRLTGYDNENENYNGKVIK